MLRQVYPVGTVLHDVRIEVSGNLSFGRQLGSYPILVGVPLQLPRNTITDTVVVDWGMRSVTALPVPVEINSLPASAVKWLPGVGNKKVATVIAKRPFRDLEAYRKVAGTSLINPLIRFA
jgi:radical SAM superfamily enzyme with C-terminal helix-hairpin-helix motif